MSGLPQRITLQALVAVSRLPAEVIYSTDSKTPGESFTHPNMYLGPTSEIPEFPFERSTL